MRTLRQLSEMLDSMPTWAQLALGAGLLAYSIAAIYGRMNVELGTKIFSRIPPEEIRTNKGHILQYTVIPVAVAVGYLLLLLAKYSGGTP